MARQLVHQVSVGRAQIEWPGSIQWPIALNHKRLNGKVHLITLCPITYRYGIYRVIIPKDYEFDGASIPRLFWWIPGFAPIGAHLWAALIHDWVCDNPDLIPRAIGDAVFGLMLKHASVPRWKARCMYAAVRGWSFFRTGEL